MFSSDRTEWCCFHKIPNFSWSRRVKICVLWGICLEMHRFVQAPFWSAIVAESTLPTNSHNRAWTSLKVIYLVIIHKTTKFLWIDICSNLHASRYKRFMPQLIKTFQSTCILILYVPPTSVLLRHIGTNLLSLSANLQFQIFSILASSTVCYNKF